ncbi:MAG: 3-deoxy-D-manno-octulosonic acid transferase [Magnetococcales bacterium]|nr:3-deoxy-D-manno-octulosonic acid transferase [Magnetococcales bacterium]
MSANTRQERWHALSPSPTALSVLMARPDTTSRTAAVDNNGKTPASAKFLYGIYTGVIALAGLACLPVWALRDRTTAKYRGTLPQRFGHLPQALRQDLAGHPCFWVHAVSVGEALAAQGLVEGLRGAFPHLRVVVSTVTKTGQQVVRDRFAHVDHLIYLPLDLPWIVRRVVASVRPRFVVVMETELWPNLFHALEQASVPIILVNGRISVRSFARYRRMRWAMGRFLRPVRLFCMQSAGDADRLCHMHPRSRQPDADSPDREQTGLPPSGTRRLLVTGNLKYDQALRLPEPVAMAALNQRLGPQPAAPVWVVASTHPGEEAIILEVHARLRQEVNGLRLILVPRHPERGAALAARIAHGGIPVRLFSQTRGDWSEPLLLVDEIGWLTRLYGLARIVFVGGSLVPHGGQNFLEPAAWGIPPIFGPHVSNFRDAARHLLDAEAGFQVADGRELAQVALRLLHDPQGCQEIGQRAKKCVMTHTGALDRTLAAIKTLLSEPGHGLDP